jgi:HEAT repeat protein
LTEDKAIRDLGSADPRVRWQALNWLCYCHAEDTSTLDYILRALEDTAPFVRVRAAELLCDAKWRNTPRAIPALIKALKVKVESPISFAYMIEGPACRALGVQGAVEPLRQLLDDESDRSWAIRGAAIDALAAIGPNAKPAEARLRRVMAEEGRCGHRCAAACALWKISGDADAMLPTLLKELKEGCAQDSAWILAQIGPAAKAAVPALTEALEQGDKSDRAAAAEALGKMGADAKPAVPALVKALGDDSVRSSAAEALGRIGPAARDAVPDLERVVRTGVASLSAIEALGRIGDPRAVDTLIAALADENRYVRQSAAEALGAIGDPRATAPLEMLLSDEKVWIVRSAAAKALKKIGSQEPPK